MRSDETEPLFDDYARNDRGDNKKSVVAILGVVSLFLLAAFGVSTYMWRHDATLLAECQTGTGGNGNGTTTTPSMMPTAAPTQTPAPSPGPTSAPATPAPTNADGYPVAWDAIASAVLGSMNRSADPCNDFYAYSCGQWLADNEIPAGEGRYTRAFDKLANETLEIELEIAESGWPLVGDFYRTCMDLGAIDAAGASPVEPMLTEIVAVGNGTAPFNAIVGKLAAEGVNVFFSFGAGTDERHPARSIAQFDQGGLMLPQAYYAGNATQADVTALEAYAAALFRLMPAPFNADPEGAAARAVDVQRQLAAISMGREARRDPDKTYNKIGLAALQNMSTIVDFAAFARLAGVRAGWNESETNVADVAFYRRLDSVLAPLVRADNATALREVLALHYVSAYATTLSKPFRDAHFAFSAALSGVDAAPPRSRSCLRLMDSTALGMLVGHYFVEREFKAATKTAAQALIRGVEDAFGRRMHHVPWLDNSTAALAAAEHKLDVLVNKIGYPDAWPSLAGVALGASHFGNVRELTLLAARRDAAKVDAPVDKEEWDMLPQQINAYYQPVLNEMVFPAGILRGSFYNVDAPGALNHGGIGAVMGHEMSHGFDDQGRRYDASGALKPWWPPAVVRGFEAAAACVVELYAGFTVHAGNETVHCNGNATLGENLADLGGIANSYRAYVARLAADADFAALEAKVPLAFDNLSAKQLYFVAWGQNWCTLQTPKALKTTVATDVHSPGEIRVRGPVSQTPEFAEVFGCKAGDVYAPVERCSVW